MVITSIVLDNRKEENLVGSIKIIKENPDPIKDSEVLAVRFNKEERLLLNQIKVLINEKKDGTVIKDSLIVYHNVLLHTLGREVISRISNSRRVKNDL